MSKHLDASNLYPLSGTVGSGESPFQFMFDYYGVRYFLLLDRNELVSECIENEKLREMHDAFDSQDMKKMEAFVWSALDLFWIEVARDWKASREETQSWTPSVADRYSQKDVIGLQLQTAEDGSLVQVTHSRAPFFPLMHPIENKWPEVPVLCRDQIEVLEEIKLHTLKGRINNDLCLVKLSKRRCNLLQEIETLTNAPKTANFPRILGLVSAGERNVSMLATEFVVGKSLFEVKSCAADDKEHWEMQLTEAVNALHNREAIWGDVSPANVMVENETNRIVLVDFEGGHTPGWVDEDLTGTTQGDAQGLSRLLDYIDKLPKSSDDAARKRSGACH